MLNKLKYLLVIALMMSFIFSCKDSAIEPQEEIEENDQEEINVIYPNGGEIFRSGDSVNFIWSSTNELGEYNIFYQKDSDSDWEFIQTKVNNTSLGWIAPMVNSKNLRWKVVKIVDSSMHIVDISDSTFSIYHEELLLNDQFQNIIVLDSLVIEWNSVGIENIDIKYSIDGGINWEILEKNYKAAIGNYNWKPQNISSTEVKVMLSYKSVMDNLEVQIVSAEFRIVSKSEVKEALKLFPLHVGDIWIYEVEASLMAPIYYPDLTTEQGRFTYYLKCEIVESNVVNGIKLYKTNYSHSLPDTIYKDHHTLYTHPIDFNSWIGVDPETATVLTNPEYNLIMGLGDIIDLRYSTNYYGTISVIDVGNENIFNLNREFKIFQTTHAYFGTTYKYVSGLGITQGTVWEEYRSGQFMLRGCIIDSIEYGDTNTVF